VRVSPSSRLVFLAIVAAMVLAVASSNAAAERDASAGAAQPTVGPTVVPQPSDAALPIASASGTAPSLGSLTPGGSSTPTPRPAPTSTPAPGSLTALIEALRVADESREGYARTLFRHWIDADGDGCDTREEVLIAEAVTPPLAGAGCRLTGGAWLSAYDGVEVADASRLDIDHLVPLAEAWDSGAGA
jgi:hypothetical protein